MENNLRVIITGGSRGIGRALVESFTNKGHKVAFIYKNSDALANELSRITGAIAVKADLSDRNCAFKAIEGSISALGGIDVLINNAGISYIGLFTDTDEETYRKIMGTNLDSAVFCTQAALPEMIHQKSGKIINLSSMWGEVGSSCEVIYSASKAALIGFTKALAKELGPSGINVNCITPGVIDTDMNKSLDKATLDELKEETPLSRIGSPEDIAETALFLASPSSDFITGQIIGVNGGLVI